MAYRNNEDESYLHYALLTARKKANVLTAYIGYQTSIKPQAKSKLLMDVKFSN